MVVLESYRIPSIEQRSEFEGIDYLHSPRSEQEFQKDLDTLLREYIRAPSVYEAYLTKEGELTDHAGNKFTDMVEEAVNKRIGQKGYERTWAESVGVFALQALYGLSNENDLIVLASPPGLPEEGFGENGRMSMTGITFVTVLPDGSKRITTYTIPLPEIKIKDHVKILQMVVGDQVFETVVGNDFGDNPDRHLVSRPIRVVGGVEAGGQDVLAKELGFPNFKAIEERVELALKLEGDDSAVMRRVGLTSFIAKQIVSYRDKQDKDGLRIAGKVVKMMFALEVSGEYVGWDLWKAISEFKKLVSGFRLKERIDVSQVELNNNERLWLISVDNLYQAINANQNAQNILSGSSCGSSGEWHDMFNNDWRNMDDFSKQNIMQDILESKDETYDYDHEGKCVVCHGDPRMLGPCGICKECDAKIRAQVE